MNELTQEQYHSLPIDTQEEFINNGGKIIKAAVGVSPKTISDDSPHYLSTDPIQQPFNHAPLVASHSPTNVELGEGTDIAVKESEDSPPSSPYNDGFDIKDPLELLTLLDDDIISGKVKLHKWQMRFLIDFANGGESDEKHFQAVVRACNGSGKDKYIIAPCAVWLCMRYRHARCVITSSSGVQLDNQTCAYITLLCNAANRKWGTVWKCNYRYYMCLETESPMICYATDEPGKAEGFHPLGYGTKMAIFMSEDKSIPDDINIAINKCTGYTHRVHASTPGNSYGHFFDLCATAINRSDIKHISEVRPEDYIQYKVVGAIIGKNDELLPGDCSHLPVSYAKQMARDLPGGIHGSAFKSQMLAEFGTTDEMVVIPYTYIWKAIKRDVSVWEPEEHNRGGLDLSDGGDETVLIVRNGNRVLHVIPFRFDNTEDTIAFLNEKFKEHSLVHRDALIFADCGGIGKPMLDRMRRQGWANIRYCDNRAKTTRPKTFRNWGAQAWFHLGDILKTDNIILPDDPKLSKQLSTRYYKIIDGAVHQLLSKIEMRSRGYPSPDRADACVLAFTDYKSTFVSEYDSEEKKPVLVGEEAKPQIKSAFSLLAWANGSSKDFNRVYTVNNNQKDFSYLREEIAEHNRSVLLNK
jgi:hypothetical protein